MKSLSRAAWVGIALFACQSSSAQESETSRPDLSGYTHFELRPVKTLTSVNPDAYEKFSAILAKDLEGYVARWTETDRVQSSGKRLVFEVSLLDDKINSVQKHSWLRPIRGSSRAVAQVEALDAETGAVIARATFKEAAGATMTTGAMGSSGNRMISTLAWRSSNYIIGLLSSRLSVMPAGTGNLASEPR